MKNFEQENAEQVKAVVSRIFQHNIPYYAEFDKAQDFRGLITELSNSQAYHAIYQDGGGFDLSSGRVRNDGIVELMLGEGVNVMEVEKIVLINGHKIQDLVFILALKDRRPISKPAQQEQCHEELIELNSGEWCPYNESIDSELLDELGANGSRGILHHFSGHILLVPKASQLRDKLYYKKFGALNYHEMLAKLKDHIESAN